MSLQTRKFKTLYRDASSGATSYAAESGNDTEFGQGIAGKYTSTLPTLTNGQWGFIRLSSTGGILTTPNAGVARMTSSALDLTAALEANRTYTTTFTNAWEISRIQIVFSTAQSRDITISNYDGTNLFTEHSDTGDTSTTYLYPSQYVWFGTSNDQVRFVFSQTGGACTATVRVFYRSA